MAFELKHPVEIKHLNIRKQGNEDDRELAIDIKCSAKDVPATCIASLFGAESEQDFLDAFWRDNDDHDVKFHGLTTLDLWTFYEKQHEVLFGPNRQRIEKVSKFKTNLKGKHLADLEFSVTLLKPSEALLEWLASQVMEEINLHLIPDNELPL